MAFSTTIFDTLLPQFAVDIVAIFTQDFTQVLSTARPIKAVVKEEAKVMEHPVESGAIITDHRIILPVEIELSMLLTALDYQDTYREIRSFYLNGTLLVVQTKTGIYENQLIASMPHEEDPEQFNIIPLALKLKQVQFVTAKYGVVPRNSKHATRVPRGTQDAAPPGYGVQIADWAGVLPKKTVPKVSS